MNFTEIFIFAPFLHVRVCREKGTHAKLKIFAPETQFSIRSSDGMETSVVKKCSLLKLSIIRAGIFYHSLMPDMDRGKAWNKVLEPAQKRPHLNSSFFILSGSAKGQHQTSLEELP